MKRCILVVSPGLNFVALQEAVEFGGRVIDPVALVCDFTEVDFMLYIASARAVTRVLLVLSCAPSVEELVFSFSYDPINSFNLEYIGVSGQSVRDGFSKVILPKVFSYFESMGQEVIITRKKPEAAFFVVMRDAVVGTAYYLGLDVCGDMARRAYRIFAHASSLRGDVAYRVIRELGFESGTKLLVGFAKDGVLPIEAILYASGTPFGRVVPFFLELGINEGSAGFTSRAVVGAARSPVVVSVCAFESSIPNIRAMDRNAYIAGVKSKLVVKRCSLDDCDVTFDSDEFDMVLLVVTQKDEDKLNEIYHQTHYVCKAGGVIAFLSRENWELMIPDQFKLIRKVAIERGENKSMLWILKKI